MSAKRRSWTTRLSSTGFPSRKRHQNVNIHFYYQLAMMTHGVRRGGSAAIDLAYTACGRLEAFWEFGLNPWDMAAGTLLIEEAGGKVRECADEPLDLHGQYVLGDNGRIHDEISGSIRRDLRGRVSLRHAFAARLNRSCSMADLPPVPLTLEGAWMLHQMFRIKRAAWRSSRSSERERIIERCHIGFSSDGTRLANRAIPTSPRSFP